MSAWSGLAGANGAAAMWWGDPVELGKPSELRSVTTRSPMGP
jgi:hypothetical protein